MSSQTPYLQLVRTLFERDPGAAANTLETMEEEEAVKVLEEIPASLTSEAFSHLHAIHAAMIIRELSMDTARDIFERLDPKHAFAILTNLSSEKRKDLLDHLTPELKTKLQELLAYPEDSAGRIMTTEFIAFHKDTRVKDAVARIRSLARKNAPISYTYVIDDGSQLLGVLNMRDLLLNHEDVRLKSLMRTDIFAVNAFMDREEVANELAERRYLAVPVVDGDRRLLGVVKSEQIIEHVQEEATEDILRMAGAGVDERPFSPVSFSIRMRLPWLYFNLLTAFAAASVVALFESLIARITILAVFLPVVAGQGGNAGAQTLAVVIRGLVMRELPPDRAWFMIRKEALLGIVNGTLVGGLTALVVWLWNGNPYLGLVIGLAMVVTLLTAGVSGAAIPISMRLIGLDPAQSSSILITTVTDVVGFFSFLGFALLFQQHLL